MFEPKKEDLILSKIDTLILAEITCRVQKPEHTTGGSGRGGARRGGRAGRGRAGRDADGSVRPGDNRPSYPPRHRRQLSRTSIQKHDQAKSYVNRWRNENRV